MDAGAGKLEAEIDAATVLILSTDYVVALTGAEVSVESGIPPFRGPGGIWTMHGEPPMDGYRHFLADLRGWWKEQLRRSRGHLGTSILMPSRTEGTTRWRR